MRIVVFSDSHGLSRTVENIVTRQSGVDMYVFLGDGEREVNALCTKYPALDIRSVSGNCDYFCGFHSSLVIDTDYARLLCVHGHKCGVKFGLEHLHELAVKQGCNIALFGHTHQRCNEYRDGIYFLNPGSCASPRDNKPPSYGYIDLTDAGIVTNIVDL